MNRFYFASLVFVCILVSFSCQNKKKSLKEQEKSVSKVSVTKLFPEIDLQKEYPKKEIKLQDIAEVTYIPFEIDDNGLLSVSTLRLLHWQGDTIITFRNKTVHIFDSSGKFLNSFNCSGGGPEEYQYIQNIAVDFNAREIFVYDHLLRFHILVYSFEGKYKRTLKLSNNLALSNIFDYDANFLFCEDEYNMLDPDRILNKTPYFLISKETGEVKPLSIEIAERIGKRFYVGEGENETLFTFHVEPIMKNDFEIIIADNSLDTVYSLRNNVLKSFALRKKRTSKDGYPILSTIEAISDKYILWGVQERNVDVKTRWAPDRRQLLFDRESGEICEVQMVNSDFSSSADMKKLKWFPSRYQAVVPGNCIIHPLSAGELIELYNQGHLNGRLKEIASKLEEEDNPVLTLIRFKE